MKINKVANITKLTQKQLDKINAFLVQTPFAPFDQDTTALFKNENPEVIALIDTVAHIRGKVVEPKKRWLNLNEESYDDVVDRYIKTLNEEDYTKEDYTQLIKEFRDNEKSKVVVWGIILKTTKFNHIDLLLVNEKYEPLGFRTENCS